MSGLRLAPFFPIRWTALEEGESYSSGVCGLRNQSVTSCELFVAKGAFIGNTKKNPFYEEICDAASVARLDFIINAVYNFRGKSKRLCQAILRSPPVWHDISSKEFSVMIDQDADVSIVSAFPLEDESPQVLKASWGWPPSPRKRGDVILVTGVREGSRGLLRHLILLINCQKVIPKGSCWNICGRESSLLKNAPIDFNAALDYTLPLSVSRKTSLLFRRMSA